MDRASMRKLGFALSLLSFVSLLVGFNLFLKMGYDQITWSSCGERFLMFVAAPILAVAGIVTGVIAGREAGASRWLRIGSPVLAVVVLVFAGLLALPPLMLPLRMGCTPPSGESTATNWVHALNDAISVHVALHHELPKTLQELGILDELRQTNLNRGWKMDYNFTYTPGLAEADGSRRRYTILARPIQFGKTGGQNFFTDESGVVRFTTQDRPATAQDCRVEDWQRCK